MSLYAVCHKVFPMNFVIKMNKSIHRNSQNSYRHRHSQNEFNLSLILEKVFHASSILELAISDH